MSIANLADTDVAIKNAVWHQLEWDPKVDASQIGVTVTGGTVTLTGLVGTYADKLLAERTAKRVRGVRTVANDIEVRLKLQRPDADLAIDVDAALRLNPAIPATVQAAIHTGHVTLTGAVTWLYQSREAERAVRHIRGVRHVMNHMTVSPRALPRDVRHRIAEALHRNATVDVRNITVDILGDKVILTGTVRSWDERQSAELAAADAPGIIHVENRIVVEPRSLDADPDEVC